MVMAACPMLKQGWDRQPSAPPPPPTAVKVNTHSVTKAPELGERAVLQAFGGGRGGGSNSLDYDNTWYYQSNCALAESGVHQVLHNLGFIDDC